jgi:hypothetical protein
MTIGVFSIYAQQAGSLLIALLGIFLYKKRSNAIRILCIYGLNSFCFQLIIQAIIFFKLKGYNNLVGNIYTITEALILLSLFYNLFTSAKSKKLTLAMGLIYLIVFFFFFLPNPFEAISSIRSLRDIMMIVCSLFYFYFLITDMPTKEIISFPMFWIAAGMLFFFAGTFVLSLSLDYLVKVLKNDLIILWTTRNFFRLFFCLVVSYGLWLDLKQVKAKHALVK